MLTTLREEILGARKFGEFGEFRKKSRILITFKRKTSRTKDCKQTFTFVLSKCFYAYTVIFVSFTGVYCRLLDIFINAFKTSYIILPTRLVKDQKMKKNQK